MADSPFHILYQAKKLASYASGQDKLIPAFASANINVYPHQVAGATFALRSPYRKGVLLCDEGGLGKSYVCLLVILQRWAVGRQKVLFIIPSHLRKQWREVLESRVSVPSTFVDSNAVWEELLQSGLENPFEQEAIVVTTYDFAVEKAELLSRVKWETVMFDEAGRLRKSHTEDAKEARILKNAVGDAFKILLTATPMQLNIMDLFGLVYFIDESVFPDERVFYGRYFRKPENYPELAARVGTYCFRTLRSQAKQYAKIPDRLLAAVEYEYTPKEKELYNLIEKYLHRPIKAAFPQMDPYELALTLYKTMSSSVAAFARTLDGVVKRLQDNPDAASERKAFEEMLALAEGITYTAKGETLIKCLELCLRALRRRGAKKKALLFVESRVTQRYLQDILSSKYRVITYSGDNRDDDITEKFRNDAEILITTDLASEGLHFEFCSLVIHYDLAYNTLKMEQRIDRCHRMDQQNDVIALSLINRNNYADVRVLELVGKRTLLMDGVFGLSDDVVGGFTTLEGLPTLLEAGRTRQEIEAAFTETLQTHEEENKERVDRAEELLFATFTKSAADQIHITPQYVESKRREINDGLWRVLRWFFGRHPAFLIDEDARSIRTFHNPAPHVFTGARLGRDEYSMTDKTLPKSGWITIGSSMVQNVLREIFWNGIHESGGVVVDGDLPDCEIGLYEITVSTQIGQSVANYTVLAGQESGGRMLDERRCREIMELPVIRFHTSGRVIGKKDGLEAEQFTQHPLDRTIEADGYLARCVEEYDAAGAEEIAKQRAATQDRKTALLRELDSLRSQLAAPPAVASIAEKLLAEKQRSKWTQALKRKEQNLYLDELRLDVALEDSIKRQIEQAKLKATCKRLFLITVTGGKANG